MKDAHCDNLAEPSICTQWPFTGKHTRIHAQSILGNALCYIISGLILLVIGVVITSATFQNLESGYEEEHTERFAGPILIVCLAC